MRILHLSDRWTDRGGAYRHLLGVVARQAREHEVRLAVGRDDGRVRAPCELSVVPGLSSRTRHAVDLAELVESVEPDVVHVHTVVNPEALEGVASLAGIPKVITVQDHRYFCPTRGKWRSDGRVCTEPMSREVCAGCFTDEAYFEEIYELTKERLAALEDFRVVVLSRYMKKELVTAGLPPAQIEVIPPFVHGLDVRAPAAGRPCVLFVGRLVETKGVEDAIGAWKRSRVSLPLVIAGTGPLRDRLENSGAELLGWVPHARLASLYRRAHALLMPSRWQEPFGIVGLEALTLGTPVVAWESGAIAEWHPSPNLVAWGDLDGLARELRAAVETKAEPPKGYEPIQLMKKLMKLYRGPGLNY